MLFKAFVIVTVACATLVVGCKKEEAAPSAQSAATAHPPVLTPDEARAIAEEAYIYAYPMLENYRTMYVQALAKTAPGYMAPFNQFAHKTELLGPEFKDIVRPNNDTLYSMAWLDLRAQPIVVSVPEVKDRYYSVQLVDMFTHNFGYIGTRTTGTASGSYMIVGPQWKGARQGNIAKVFRSESDFVLCIVRTEVDGPKDVPAVVELQKRYRLTPLHVFLGRSRAPVAAGITFPSLDPNKAKSAGFIDYLNFLLTLVSIHPDEKETMERFALIGIQRGNLSASLGLSPAVRHAMDEGVGRALVAISKAAGDGSEVEGVTGRSENGWQGAIGLFGSPDEMRTKYIVRAFAAMVGLYGNDAEEAYYPIGNTDASGEPYDGSKHNYVMRFEKGEDPPVDAFWSMTMYSLPDQLMVANPINRYSIGDRSKLRRGKDGSITIYIQNESPGKKKESNWLPAPDGPFSLQFRMYLPKPEALDPLYLPPPVRVAQ